MMGEPAGWPSQPLYFPVLVIRIAPWWSWLTYRQVTVSPGFRLMVAVSPDVEVVEPPVPDTEQVRLSNENEPGRAPSLTVYVPWTTLVQSWVLPVLLSAFRVLPSVLPALPASFRVKLLGSAND